MKAGKTLTWIAIYGVVAYGAYHFFFSKAAYARQIVSRGKYGSGVEALKSFDMAYLRAWAKAAKANRETFDYQGKTYNTQGGKLKQ